jgi:hypothetical protein
MESQNIYLHLKVLHVRAVAGTVQTEHDGAAHVKY